MPDTIPTMERNPTPAFEELESRQLLNAAFDLIGLSQLRSDPTYSGIDGSGVTVAILDTGLDRTHSALAANYVAGDNEADGGSDPVDREGHGTHVSGIIGARDPEIGVATRAGLVGVKVLSDNGSGTMTDIRDGLRWVYDHRVQYNILVVNMSLGSGFYSSVGQDSGDILLPEVRRLESAGITVVSAAGNSFKNHEYQNVAAPGLFSTLGVGAVWKDGTNTNVQWADGAIDYTTGAGRITSFSQRLTASNIVFAPGALIRSTVPGNSYEQMAGTSQASPVVAGCVALMQEAAQQFGGRRLSTTEVRNILVSTAVSIFDGDDENDNVQNTQVNYPRINVYAAIQEVKRRLQGSAPTPPPGDSAPDANGTISGAFLVDPALDGSETLTAAGSIGLDGTANVGGIDVDMYKFTTASKGIVTISVGTNTTSPSDFDSYLRLFSADGTLISGDDNGGGGGFSRISMTLDAGTYYVGVSGAGNATYDPTGATGRSAGATGNYGISFSLANNDPNGLFAGSVAVNFGTDKTPTTFQGLIGRDYGNPVGTSDVDMFKVVAPDNGVIIVNIDTPDFNGYVDSYLRIFDDQGTEVASDDDTLAPGETARGTRVYDSTQSPIGHTTDSYKLLTIERGKTYYVCISDYNNRTYDPATLEGRLDKGTGGTYDISLRFRSVDTDGAISLVKDDAPFAFPFGPISASIGADSDLPVENIVGNKDVDFYHVRVNKASLLQISVSTVASDNFDTVLYLYDANGKLLASNDDFTGIDPTMQYVIQASTDYFVAVAAFGNNSFDPFAAGSGTASTTGIYSISGVLFAPSAVKTISDDALNFAKVQTVTPGQSLRGVLGSDSGFSSGSSDVDLYKFVAPSDGILTVNADGYEQFSADTFLRLFDSGGKELAFNDNRSSETRGSTVAFAAKKGKVYYVGVTGAGANPRAYNPKNFGSSVAGSTGTYSLAVVYDIPPTLTLVSNLSIADAGRPFAITYDGLAAAANEVDPEGRAISFVIGKVTGGTLSKNGIAIAAGVTEIGTGEQLVWTPSASSSGVVKAFTVSAKDGVQLSAKPVQVSVVVNQAPTLTSVKDIPAAVGAASVNISFATLLAAANESDKNKDSLQFRIESVLSGSANLGDVAVLPGVSLFGPGGVLTLLPASSAKGKVAAFTIRAYDGRLVSAAAVTVWIKFG
jgi:hypothetical protein